MTTITLSYDYQSNSNQPPSGKAYQSSSSLGTISFNYVDQNGINHQSGLSALAPTDTITVNGVTWTIDSITPRGSNVVFAIHPSVAATPYGVTNFVFTKAVPDNPEVPQFPAFTPILPPPLIGQGGGLVGPAIAPAPVPPSVAGVVQPQFKTGSATSPAASGYFPQFTTTFPVPTVAVDGAMIGSAVPPHQTSTLSIVLDGWGPNVPPGAPTGMEAGV